jgi:hypothetical protein
VCYIAAGFVIALAGCDRVLQLDDIKPATDIDSGLIAYYPLDSNDCAKDGTGKGHDGACTMGVPTVIAGHVGQAFAFDGATEIDVPYAADLDTPEGTVAFWVQVERGTQSTTQCAVNRVLRDIGENSWQICPQPYDDSVYFGTSSTFVTIGMITIGDDQWHHLAITWTATATTGWLDGQEMFLVRTSPIMFDAHGMTLGADNDSGLITAPLAGNLDEVRIYGRVLSERDIGALAAM